MYQRSFEIRLILKTKAQLLSVFPNKHSITPITISIGLNFWPTKLDEEQMKKQLKSEHWGKQITIMNVKMINH